MKNEKQDIFFNLKLRWNQRGDEKNTKSQIIMGIGLKGKTKLYSRFRNVKKYEEKLSFLFLCCLVFSPWVCNDRNSVEWGEFLDVFLIDGMVNQNEWLFEFAQLEWFAISNRSKNMNYEDEGTLELLKSQKIGAHSGF